MQKDPANTLEKKKFQLPDTWVLLFIMVVIAAILSWIVTPGSYDYEKVEINGVVRNLAIDGTYHTIDKAEAQPASFLGVFSALYQGCVNGASTIFMIMCCCSCFRIMVQTGAFHAGIGTVIKKLGRSALVIVFVLMIIFALCGSVFGMLSELYGFYPLLVGLGVALGYDAIFGFSILALGEYVGFSCGTLNPYNVGISQGIAGVPLYSNIDYRFICLVVCEAIAMVYLLRYGAKVRKDPSRSLVYGRPCIHSFNSEDLEQYKMNPRFALVLVDLLITLVVLMIGLMKFGWGNKQLCGLFIIMSMAAAVIMGWDSKKYVTEFTNGCKSIIWGALIAGLSQAILVIMNDAKIIDTVIFGLAELLKHAPKVISAQLLLIVQTLINFPVTSATGQAAVTMPIMAPLADVLGVSRDVACLAYQFGDGLSNLLWPTCSIVTICGLADIPYEKWLKFFTPLFGILVVAQMVLMAGAVLIGI